MLGDQIFVLWFLRGIGMDIDGVVFADGQQP
jgi:hypothetical protein